MMVVDDSSRRRRRSTPIACARDLVPYSVKARATKISRLRMHLRLMWILGLKNGLTHGRAPSIVVISSWAMVVTSVGS